MPENRKTNPTSKDAIDFYQPYASSTVNFLYNLLFCDDISLFKGDSDSPVWKMLLAEDPDYEEIDRIAENNQNESRVRMLAYNRLRAARRTVVPKQLLGVIVEVPLEEGLDVLAAYADGSVRYLNQLEKVAIFEGDPPELRMVAQDLLLKSQALVEQIGPWKEKRLPPPRAGNVRMTFLVSDGLYFGEGAFHALQRDRLGGPVIAKATELVQLVAATHD